MGLKKLKEHWKIGLTIDLVFLLLYIILLGVFALPAFLVKIWGLYRECPTCSHSEHRSEISQGR